MPQAHSLPPMRKPFSLSVSARVILLTVVVWIGLLAGAHVMQDRIFRPTFVAIESDLVIKDLERVEAAVAREVEQLSRVVDDYASWEDMRAFIGAEEGAPLSRAFKPEILTSLDLDAIFVFNAIGRVRHSLTRKDDSVLAGSPEYTPTGFANQFPVIASVRTQGGGGRSSQGLVRFRSGRLVFAVAAPVPGATPQDPALGTVVMLRELDDRGARRLADQVRLPVVIAAKEPTGGVSPSAREATPVLENNQIGASAWLRDPFGLPIAEYSITRPATILTQGEGTLLSGEVASVVVLSIVLLCLILLLQWSVIRPLARLTRIVESVRRTGDLSVRIHEKRSDEIGLLAHNFDRMLALLDERTRTLEELATTDGLTRLANRRTIMEHVTQLVNAANDGTLLSVLVIDVDHFKRINDTVGHSVGDRVLRHVAAVIRKAIGPNAMGGRLGGEEFLVVVTGLVKGDVVRLAETVRAAIAESPVQGVDWPVTASIGVGHYAGHTVHGLLATADLNLYRAKGAGRNRVVADEVAASLLPAASVPPPPGGGVLII
jgi:diguanylate cyclase (GGDEF)-like protein